MNIIYFFEKTYLIQTIGVHTSSIDREIVKTRKLYFCDTGLANVLSEINSGAQFENTAFNQLSRIGQVQYYSLKNGNEIDFILDEKLAIESKETPIEDDLRKLESISKIAKVNKFTLIGRHKSPKFKKYVWGGCIF